MLSPFLHLHVHSAYSLSESTLRIPTIIDLCLRYRMPAVAITDTNAMFNAMEFSLTAAEKGIQPILGCQLDIALDDDLKQPCIFLAQTQQGYTSLIQMISAFYKGHRRLFFDDVQQMARDLIVLINPDIDAFQKFLSSGERHRVKEICLGFDRLFPERIYLEIQRSPDRSSPFEPFFFELADTYRWPLVATNPCYFADPSEFKAHDTLLCIASNTFLAQENRRRGSPEHWFKPAQEMRTLFHDLPDAIDNTLLIARRCSFFLQAVDKPSFPAFALPKNQTEDEELVKQAESGFSRKLDSAILPRYQKQDYPQTIESYKQRLKYERDTIISMGFSGYFLIVSDFLKWARRRNIFVSVRGSGATSLVAWCLDITNLDPIAFNLVFERFLNPERVSMPDFDIDFCQERRHEVIAYVQEKYGSDHVAQIITFGTFQPRLVFRDVGRALHVPGGRIHYICSLIPSQGQKPVSLANAIEQNEELQKLAKDPEFDSLFSIAAQLEGLPRHPSTHAAGLVIGNRPLHTLIPLYQNSETDIPLTQFSMKYVESAGLVKFDFLGLKNLSVMSRTQALIQKTDPTFDIQNVPLDDPETYQMLSQGQTFGIFQLEGDGMKRWIRELRPDCIEDIIALLALYRPGPIESIPDYIDRKHGKSFSYLHPKLEPILRDTYGIMTYQEDVLRIARELAGYTFGKADILRRAMGKKIQSEMDLQRIDFIQGCRRNGIPQSSAETIFDQAAKFAGYGFNKGHAAAYAILAYQTAYLKRHYPREYLASMMTLDSQNFDQLQKIYQELKRWSISLLPPDINLSQSEFALEDGGDIRYSFTAIKGVGGAMIKAIIANRLDHGPFTSLENLIERLLPLSVTKSQLEQFCYAGALESLSGNRAQTLEEISGLLQDVSMRQRGQNSLFQTPSQTSAVPDWSLHHKLTKEYNATGFYLSRDPFDPYQYLFQHSGVQSFTVDSNGSSLYILASIVSKTLRYSKTGQEMIILKGIEKDGDFFESFFMGKQEIPLHQPLVLLIEAREGRAACSKVLSVSDFLTATIKTIGLPVRHKRSVHDLYSVIRQVESGSTALALLAYTPESPPERIDLPQRVRVTPEFLNSLDALSITPQFLDYR